MRPWQKHYYIQVTDGQKVTREHYPGLRQSSSLQQQIHLSLWWSVNSYLIQLSLGSRRATTDSIYVFYVTSLNQKYGAHIVYK